MTSPTDVPLLQPTTLDFKLHGSLTTDFYDNLFKACGFDDMYIECFVTSSYERLRQELVDLLLSTPIEEYNAIPYIKDEINHYKEQLLGLRDYAEAHDIDL
jgi:tryptophanyl-tRNA synthetase